MFILEEAHPRQAFLDATRANLDYVRQNAPAEHTFEKLAGLINGTLQTKWDKGSVRHFLLADDRGQLPRLSIEKIKELYDVSCELRMRVQQAFGELPAPF